MLLKVTSLVVLVPSLFNDNSAGDFLNGNFLFLQSQIDLNSNLSKIRLLINSFNILKPPFLPFGKFCFLKCLYLSDY
jgi:hypothetical protein